MGSTISFRSTPSKVLAVATAAVCAIAGASFLVADGMRGIPGALWVAFIAVGAWLAFWSPCVVVSDGEIVVHNIVQRVHIPWPAYRSVSTTWNLAVQTTTGEVTAWSAPRAGAVASRTGRSFGGTSAETVAAEIEARHDTLVDGGYLTGIARPGQPVTERHWNVPAIAVLVAVGAAAIAATIAG